MFKENKSCEITLRFTNWEVEKIILKLTGYINNGFKLNSWSVSHENCSRIVDVELFQYDNRS